ncbi:hypothetical protein B566_EDAN012263 [Ephemera danica]|nr:hypothetical protein B566_EDAN012263 [Ephemera danica]
MFLSAKAFSLIQRQGLRCKAIYPKQITPHKVKYFTASAKSADSTKMSSAIEIDLRSDTVTKPTQVMRNAMATAPVGDDVFEEDPTVKALEQKSAQMLGMEAALYVPSGTMSNLIATLVHCNRRGSEMIAGNLSHMFLYEQGGAAQFGGVQINVVPNLPDGTFDLNAMQSRIRTRDLHEPMTALVCVENTHNKCGGKVLPLPWLKELVARCSALGLPLHMDGARLHNAAVYLGVPAKQAKRMRKALGGGMRQCGIIAAAGIVALDTMIDRLVDDHKNARALAQVRK